MELEQVKKSMCAKLIGENVAFQFVSTDSRTTQPGDLFIALVGPNFDGHEFVEAAEEKGAVATVVSRDVKCKIPKLLIDDTLTALGELAALRRDELDIPVVAITGSCGKTSTKGMVASIFEQCGNTHYTHGTLNNEIGVPLTLLKLTADHEYAVIELGANHVGEISYTANMVRPTVAVITNAAPVHLEGFGDVKGVSRVKGEIFEGLMPDGVAVLNADDPFFDYWKGLVGDRRIVSFGLNAVADIRASHLKRDRKGCFKFVLETPQGEIKIHLSLPGEHNVFNAAAACAVAFAVDAPLKAIKKGLETIKPIEKRMVTRKGMKGSVIIDDSYNANPASFLAALNVLKHHSGEKVLIVGDMAELGENKLDYHRTLGEQAREAGVNRVFAIGKYTPETVAVFEDNAQHFQDKTSLVYALKTVIHDKMTILVKGSNRNRLWEVVNELIEEK